MKFNDVKRIRDDYNGPFPEYDDSRVIRLCDDYEKLVLAARDAAKAMRLLLSRAQDIFNPEFQDISGSHFEKTIPFVWKKHNALAELVKEEK